MGRHKSAWDTELGIDSQIPEAQTQWRALRAPVDAQDLLATLRRPRQLRKRLRSNGEAKQFRHRDPV